MRVENPAKHGRALKMARLSVDDDVDLSLATAVISGGSLALGLALADRLRQRGYRACVAIDAASGDARLGVIVRAKETKDWGGQAAAYSLAYELGCFEPDVRVEVCLERRQ
jgi:NAD(P)-dependent dehydrogenase (short-subunit alcohol dehydrogenase family)